MIILLFASFSHQHELVIFHGNLSDSKSPWVSRSLLSILANLTNSVVRIVSILPLISNFTSLFTSLWGSFQAHLLLLVLLSPPCSTLSFFFFRLFLLFVFCLFVCFCFLFFVFLAGFVYSSIFLTPLLCGPLEQKHNLWISTRSGLLAVLRWSVCISKSKRILWVFFSRTDSGLWCTPFDSMVKF